ncbi:MFS transporter [Rossellomorea sp. YZS02]|uniref:MFS transporter n=1 Tax=Rossellomorea sp. YZS02 TaxID=3097358 RepID=UPI002A0DCBA1|nr:MFS transporter [Rossellomorea sp. YZS02]MDX8342171.1 MFS transporter [Rossellomorea sp. YZS02]
MRGSLREWKAPGLLLGAVGISYIGDFIYLVALNLFIFAKTDSVAAVAGLWIIGPIAGIITGFWSGSIIDRLYKKHIMILMDVLRGCFVAVIPLMSELWSIYAVLFIISLCSSFFRPASTAYTVQLVPKENLLRYNSLSSILTTGSLVLGPAIAGALIQFSSYQVAIWCNAVSFLISGVMIFFLPNLHIRSDSTVEKSKYIKIILDDLRMVLHFLKKHRYFLAVYLLFQFIMTLAIALDSQEVVFTQKVIGLTESQFSLLMSITGAGYLIGSILMSMVAKKMTIPYMIGFGTSLFSAGYVIYSFSTTFLVASIGFIILGFFSSFANTGFQTFFQTSIPSHQIGRIGTTLSLFQSSMLIVTILLAGLLSEVYGVKYLVIGTTLIIALIAALLCALTTISHLKEKGSIPSTVTVKEEI